MEGLFSPCTRYRDILESQGRLEELRGPRRTFQELDLNVSTEELIIPQRAFTYADLYAMLGNEDTIAWLTPPRSCRSYKYDSLGVVVPLPFQCRQ
jgi:hypothetical protein